MKPNLYIVSLRLPNGGMQNYAVVSASRAKAEAKAIELAQLPADTEPHTTQCLHTGIDAVIS
jgi:hypothetical protein